MYYKKVKNILPLASQKSEARRPIFPCLWEITENYSIIIPFHTGCRCGGPLKILVNAAIFFHPDKYFWKQPEFFVRILLHASTREEFLWGCWNQSGFVISFSTVDCKLFGKARFKILVPTPNSSNSGEGYNHVRCHHRPFSFGSRIRFS